MIDFTEKELNSSLNYLQTEAEAAAYQAISRVLKRGLDISSHENHKDRGYETVTIAAPIILNDERANLAVVVKRTKGNRYKVHRVLTPSGENFVLPKMANAEPTPPVVSPRFASASGGTGQAINSAFDTTVAEKAIPVKRQFSISEPVERTDALLALHNMDGEKIDSTLDLGAWPSPSIAIAGASQGNADYGEYTVVFSAGTIDPEAENDVELEEAVAVAAPNDAPIERIERMKSAGRNVVLYQADNEQDRLEKVNSLNAQFSIDEEEPQEAKLPGGEDAQTITRDTLPVKAVNYLKRTEWALLDRISAALSVPRFARREFLDQIVREISEEYLRTGKVNQETLNRLFNTAYEQGIVVEEEFYRQYKHIKDYLRTQAISISDADKEDVPDFGDFMRRARGLLRIVNRPTDTPNLFPEHEAPKQPKGLAVDVAYQELQGMAPELFPENFAHPADQLVHMLDVATSIQRVENFSSLL